MGVARDSSSTFLIQATCQALSLASSIVVARVLGAEFKGVVAITLLAPTLLLMLCKVGLSPSLPYLIGRRESGLRAYLGSATVIGVGVSGGALFVVWWFLPSIRDHVFPEADPYWLGWATTAVPLLCLLEIAMGTALGLGRIGRYNATVAVRGGLLPLLTIGAVGIAGLGVGGAVVALLLASGVGAIYAVWVIGSSCGWRWEWDRERARELVSYAGRVYPGAVLSLLNQRIDLLLLGILGSVREVGVYSIAAMAQKLGFLASSVQLALISRITRMPENDRVDLVCRAARITFWLSAGVALLGGAACPWLIPFLFGPEFAGALIPLWILLAGMVVQSVGVPLHAYFGAVDRPGTASFGVALNLVVNVTLNLWLIPRYGMLGAAGATATGFAVNTAFLFRAFLRQAEVRPIDLVGPRRRDLEVVLRLVRTRGAGVEERSA